MPTPRAVVLLLAVLPVLAACAQDAPLLRGVKAVWDLPLAVRQATPTRERVCINGLWQWQPADAAANAVPPGNWGSYKVPGDWPGIQDYMKSDYQTLYPNPAWGEVNLGGLKSAWYQRTITIPADWAGRRIALRAEYLNSLATVFVDGTKVGQMFFPCGRLEITNGCRPGATHTLSLHVVAMPLREVMEVFRDTNTGRQVRGSVARRGLCGDIWLIGEPVAARVENVRARTSVRRGELTIAADVDAPAGSNFHAVIRDGDGVVAEFDGPAREPWTVPWKPDKRWDIHTPQNQYDLSLSLLDNGGKLLDEALPVRFGFREFWIDGRDFYLNGTPIHLSAVPFDNAQVGAALSTYDGAKESLLRLKSFGINFVYTHNYSCDPGAHLAFTEILRAADDVGMLFALSQPHFSSYDWDAADADTNNGYAAHAAWYAEVAGSHPAVVAYATSHNATGYREDMDPDLIDGLANPRDGGAQRNADRAMRAQAIIESVDPSRIVYHHSSGNLGTMHTSNFYPNWTPVQELDDWLEHWATEGVKPFFTVEYGAPFGWDWAMYRGWYNDRREFGSAVVPWEFCLAEWNAQFLGDAGYAITDREAANLRWEAKQYAAGRTWHRWDYPTALGDRRLHELQPVQEMYLTANWRAFRTWGMSANSPWEAGRFWDLKDDAETARKELPVDWDHLQRPGFSPDYIDRTYQRSDLAYRRDEWQPLAAAKSLQRNNMPLLAWIAGPPDGFTKKDHLFRPGETVTKQLIVINDSRETVTVQASWSIKLPTPQGGELHAVVETGRQARLPIEIRLPDQPGTYRLLVDVDFGAGGTQTDTLDLEVLPPRPAVQPSKRAIFDPVGDTTEMLTSLGVTPTPVTTDADLSGYETLLIGKGALTVDGPGPDLSHVPDGLKVICFEQTKAALEHRLGFRIAEYGLRQAWPRVPDHPVLAGLTAEALRDWRGAATLTPERLTFDTGDGRVEWAGMQNTRVWRCGNRGNVASVMIEKPARGDFLSLVDGGFALEYSPLLEYRDGRGMVIFCQLDVSGRTESEPAAERLVAKLLNYVVQWQPAPRRQAGYVGEASGRDYFAAAGLTLKPAAQLGPDDVLIVGPGATDGASKAGYRLAFGLDQDSLAKALGQPVETKLAEHIATTFAPPSRDSLLAGIGPGEVHNRAPQDLPLVTSGAQSIGDGVLAQTADAHAVICALVPWRYASEKQDNLKRTARRINYLAARLLGNLGVAGQTPLLARFAEPVGAVSGDSLLRNSSFADDADGNGIPDGWGIDGQSSREKQPDGAWAVSLIAMPVAESDKPPTRMLYQMDVPLVQDQWYRIRFRAKAADWSGAGVTLAVQNTAGWSAAIPYQRFRASDEWQDLRFDVQAKETVPKGTRFQLWFSGTGTLTLADLSMKRMADPTVGRWSSGLYLDQATEWDDPYRFFRW